MNRVTGTFDVVGAESALAYFGGLEPARLAHGYLFTGAVGVGKKTFAKRLAQSLLCSTPKPTILGYCGTCTDCKLFVAGTHPDFLISEGTIKIGDDDGNAVHDGEITSRDLIRAFAMRAYRGAHRVVVLGDLSFATREAANALLKFLEEPPSGVVVLITSSASGALLDTVRSRLIDITLGPIATADVERVLLRSGVDPDRAHLAASAALGSLTRARAIVDGETSVRDEAFAWFASAVRGETPDGGFLRLDDKTLSGAEKRAAVGDLIETVRVGVRDWAALRMSADDTVPLLAADQRERIAALPPREPATIVALLADLLSVERVAASNVSAGLVADYLRMQLAPR